MKFKKPSALLSLLLALLICLSSCGGEGTSQSSQQDSSVNSSVESDSVGSQPSDSSADNSQSESGEASTDTSGDTSTDTSKGDASDDNDTSGDKETDDNKVPTGKFPDGDLPTFEGDPFVAINDYIPFFTEDEITNKSYENYSELDDLGRCGVTMACVGRDIMPDTPRESISSVKPSGWNNVKYDTSLVDGGYIYNRCHLLGFQLTGENANKQNLITGTRYMNVEGMLPFENMIADYIKDTNNHVMLRVTPIFVEEELVARGVLMEAYSVEDEGEGICYNVYCFNVQPGITINYADGSSYLGGSNPENPDNSDNPPEENAITYILNTNTKKFHYSDCASAKKISDKNYGESTKSREELIADGYSPCGNCDP